MVGSSRAVLEEVGLDPGDVTALVTLLGDASLGILDREDFTPAPRSRESLALHAALVALTNSRRYQTTIGLLTEWLEPKLEQLSSYDTARFWHMRGIAALRFERSPFAAIRALNIAAHLLAALQDNSIGGTGGYHRRGAHYLARVHDTFGQILLQQGLLSEAHREFSDALKLRAPDDDVGRGITLGNLGRVCMDIGDFGAAVRHLEEDLEIIRRDAEPKTWLIVQLLSHIATCKLRLGDSAGARAHFIESERVAKPDDVIGRAYANIGVGRVELVDGNPALALEVAQRVAARIAEPDVAEKSRPPLLTTATRLSADALLALGQYDAAVRSYHAAMALASMTAASTLEYAEILRGLSMAFKGKGERGEAINSLRQALEHLDKTAAEKLRSDVESELKEESKDAWLLHSAGRFVGQSDIAQWFTNAGHEGFRGAREAKIVMFADLRGFTSMSEKLEPDELILRLNEFFTQMTRCIERHGGAVDKFIGDAIMATFPLETGLGDRNAIHAALAMRADLERFNRRFDKISQLSIGIGLHGGTVVSGLVGSPQKRAVTVIGDVVNTASRLEGMTKQLGASTLVTDVVVEAVGASRFLLRPLGTYSPKGRKAGIAVYDVMGVRDRSPISERIANEIARSEAALASFRDRDFMRSAALFNALGISAPYAHRAGYELLEAKSRELAVSPPQAEWAGEIALLDK